MMIILLFISYYDHKSQKCSNIKKHYYKRERTHRVYYNTLYTGPLRWGVRPRVLNGSKNRAPATAAAAVSAQHANSPRITQLSSHADRRRRRLSDGLFTLLNLACMSAVAPGQPSPPHSRTRYTQDTHTYARGPSTVRDDSPTTPHRTFFTIFFFVTLTRSFICIFFIFRSRRPDTFSCYFFMI